MRLTVGEQMGNEAWRRGQEDPCDSSEESEEAEPLQTTLLTPTYLRPHHILSLQPRVWGGLHPGLVSGQPLACRARPPPFPKHEGTELWGQLTRRRPDGVGGLRIENVSMAPESKTGLHLPLPPTLNRGVEWGDLELVA